MFLTSLKKVWIVCTFICFLLSTHALSSQVLQIPQDNISLLEHSSVYFDEENLTFSEVIQKKKFNPYKKSHINIGPAKQTVWVKISLHNSQNPAVDKILLFYSIFLEHIFLYDENGTQISHTKGQAHPEEAQTTMLDYYPIRIAGQKTNTYYIKTYSQYVPLRFRLTLAKEDSYIKSDQKEQLVNVLLVGFIFALMVYSLFISVYIKDKTYLFYGVYLFILLYDQTRFIGLSHLYLPAPLLFFDLKISILRIYALLITSSLFTLYFLSLKRHPRLYYIYVFVILLASLCMLLLDPTEALSMGLAMVMTLCLALFNFAVGVYTYVKGHTQARLYILGFSIVLLSYVFIIFDIIGIISMTQDYSNALLWATAFEALVLSLAFADRYIILQQEKQQLDLLLLQESHKRSVIVQKEVIIKTTQLNDALKSKELLLKEVHHRVKNNLHVILSMIQLQEDTSHNKILTDLENRINAIAKTYDMLIIDERLQSIDMRPYIHALISDIQNTFSQHAHTITLTSDIRATLPLKEAVYVGLIINELLTNSYKYAFPKQEGTIHISFKATNHNYTLIVEDDGIGFKETENPNTLGLSLVHTLVTEQLKGRIEKQNKLGSSFNICFSL